MKHFLLITLFIFFVFSNFVNAQCFEIESILVDACVPGTGCINAASAPCDCEGKNEMVKIKVGANYLLVNNLNVNWPNNSFLGWCQNAGTAATVNTLNASIGSGCGWLLEPTNDTLPANATVLIITSTDMCTAANSFDGLNDTIYVIFQCAGNYQGHFANNNSPGIRSLFIENNGLNPCNDFVSYERSNLVNIFGTTGGSTIEQDGSSVAFTPSGNATYYNNGCVAPITTLNAGWSFTNEICNNYGDVDLNSLLNGGTTTGGTWNGPRVIGSTYNPALYLGLDSITYTVSAITGCGVTLDSTIVFNVVEPQSGAQTIEVCDSTLISGIWYKKDTIFTDTLSSSTPYACDSLVNYTIIITPLSQDSTYIFACDSTLFNGVWYTNDTIIRDTVLAGSGGSTVIDTILKTSFEDTEGWSDHNTGNWTQVDGYGTWLANDMYANQFNPNNGSRNVGMNDVGDWLEFPPVDNPSTLYYYDKLSSNSTGTNNEFTVQYFNGTTWVNIASDICTHTNYQLVTIDLSSISTLTNVRIRIYRSKHQRSGYIDDVVVTGSTINAGSSCDSVYITNIDIAEAVIFDTIYECTIHPTNVGASNDTIRYSSACDSLITSTITQLVDTSFNDSTITICDSVIYNGVTYYTDTVLNDTLFSSLGCDSIYVQVNIIDAPNFAKTIGPIICQGDSFQLPGTTQFENTSGTYTSTIIALNSCDTTVTTNLTVAPNPIGDTIIVQDCNTSFTLPETGQVVNSNGVYNDTLNSIFNCDSIQPYNITFLTPDTGVINPTICNGSSFTLSDGTLVNTTGTYYSVGGIGTSTCDSIVTTNLTVLTTPIYYDTIYQCTINPINANTVNDTIRYNIGDFCDSLITSTITQFIDTSFNTNNITECDSVVYNGITYYSDTILSDTLFSSLACDSVYNQVNIVIAPVPVGTTINIQECNNTFTLPQTGQVVNSNGVYNDTLISSFNCDSIQPYNVTFLKPDTGIINPIICNGSSFTLSDGTLVNTTGTYYSVGGVGTSTCDSIVTTNLTVLNDPTFYDTIFHCTITPLNSGTVNDTIRYSAGNLCDSLITTTITQLIDTNSIYTYNCSIDPTAAGNDTTSIIYSDLGCDSIYNIITTNYIDTSFVDIIVNTCDSTIYNGNTFSSDTTFTDTIISALGCDSVYQQVIITITPDFTKTINPSICLGDSFLLPGTNQYEFTTGTYTSTINVTNDCDTIVTTNLSVIPTVSGTSILIQECNSSFTLPNSGQIITTNGIYNDTLVSATNCDSIQPYDITFLVQSTGTINPSICFGQNYTLSDGTVVNTAGTYTTNAGIGANGCDSILTTNLTILPNPQGSIIQIESCENSFTIPNTGQVITTNGIYNDTIPTSLCDSIQPYNITFLPNYTKTVNATICQGDSFQLAGSNQYVYTTGTYTSDIVIFNYCDTSVTTNLTVENTIITVSEDTLICAGSSVTLSAFGAQNYIWSTGATTDQITVNPSINTSYTVQGESANNCVSAIQTIQVNVVQAIANVSITTNQTTINSGENVNIEVLGDHIQTYFWTPVNNTSSSFTDQPNSSTLYIVELGNEPCPNVLDSIFINVKQAFIAIPTGFSPNGDGINDFFLVINHEDFEAYTLQVYNRWGELIFNQTANAAAWDGTFKNKNVEIGTYTYYIDAQLKNSNVSFQEKGNVTLIR